MATCRPLGRWFLNQINNDMKATFITTLAICIIGCILYYVEYNELNVFKAYTITLLILGMSMFIAVGIHINNK